MNDHSWVRFCSYEVKFKDKGLLLGQPSYLGELLQRHNGEVKRSVPLPRDAVPPEDLEEQVTAEEIKAAQGIVGEVWWIALRSRPDLAYAVSLMGREVTKRPRWVEMIGRHVLECLNGTKEHFLIKQRSMELVEMFSDISYAPQGERSVQGILALIGGRYAAVGNVAAVVPGPVHGGS